MNTVEDPYWTMHWGDKPDTVEFEEPRALALLLANEVCFLNSHWWEKEWPEQAQKTIAVCVNCNDIFAWACADAEGLEYDEIQNLYDMWKADPVWGPAKWCCIKRKQKPQGPVERDMRRDGVWDAVMESLGENTQDAEVQAMFAQLRRQPQTVSDPHANP